MNTTQTITVPAGATGTGITFPTPIYNKVSVIIEEQENVPGLTERQFFCGVVIILILLLL